MLFVAKCEMDDFIGRQHHLDEDSSKVVYEADSLLVLGLEHTTCESVTQSLSQ